MDQLKTLFGGVAGLFLVLVTTNAGAVIANPDPANLYDDVGVDHFYPGQLTASIEVADPFDVLTSFGFYFLGTPGDRYTIFDALDQASPVQSALIDFEHGIVLDADESTTSSPVIQDVFAPSLHNVGFWFDIPAASTTLFTQAALNPGGLDLSWTFTSKAEPLAHVIAFEAPDGTPLSVNVIAGFRAVPEPPAIVLMLGVLLLILPLARFPVIRH